MTSRRAITQPSSLTSLVDVLFILVFAALVHAAAPRDADDADAAPAVAAEPAAPPPDAAPAPDASPPVSPELAALRERALAALADDLAGRPVVVARIDAAGVLVAIEVEGARVDLGVPLLERVPDPDVAIAYLGDRAAELRICRIAALRLGVAELADRLVVITPEVPLADLPVALVGGLRRDAERCLTEQRGVAVVVDPAALTPAELPDLPLPQEAP